MTPIADMVQEMLSRGVPAEVIVLAVRGAEETAQAVRGHSADIVDEQAERRREKDRLRKRNVRGHSAESADIPQISANALTLKKDNKKKVRAQRHPCPQTWRPSEVHFDAGAKLGISRTAVEAKAEDMRIWAGSSGALKADWDLTFHGFLRRDAPKIRDAPPAIASVDLPGFYAAFDSPQLEAWNAYERKNGKTSPRDKKGGWRFPAEWPPGHSQASQTMPKVVSNHDVPLFGPGENQDRGFDQMIAMGST